MTRCKYQLRPERLLRIPVQLVVGHGHDGQDEVDEVERAEQDVEDEEDDVHGPGGAQGDLQGGNSIDIV